MIEIVFGDSACGSLKMAQRYGVGKYPSGAFGMIVSCQDGSAPTEEEIQAARQKLEEERHEWANATPMGGDPADVYGFAFCLSIGDISEDIPGEKRRQVLEWLYSIHPDIEGDPAFTDEMMQHGKEVLQEVCARISAGEAVRIWYSNQPDELCGLYWFAAQLSRLQLREGQVLLVLLPDWETSDDGNIVTHSGWGSVKPNDWQKHLTLQTAAPSAFLRMCAAKWECLQQENAPLRAVLNGQLVNVPESLYDEFIAREIAGESDEFDEAMVIGKVLGKYELGIGDAWIAHRIEKMISAGSLIPTTNAPPAGPIYYRTLKKR